MMSISEVSAGQALTYHGKDYYTKGQQNNSTRWQGKGAEKLGLSGHIHKNDFGRLLEGKLPDGTQLGRINATGELEHRAGYDLTFSAPKSVSIAALVMQDDRLVQAHREAAAEALAYIEQQCATARVMVGGVPTRQDTGNLVIASFGHSTTRSEEPGLHDHNVVMNATLCADGQWRSLGEPAAFYRIKMEAGQLYRSTLAQKSRELGYTPVVTRAGEAVSFELKEVPAAAVAQFSSRSAAIVEYLAARGLTRETATAEQKQEAALATRKGKELTDSKELRAHWLSQMQELGIELPTAPTAPEKRLDVDAEAAKAVAFAIAKISENNSVFDLKSIRKEAEAFAFGKVSKADIEAAIKQAKADGALLDRHVIGADSLLTTPATIKDERELVANALSGVGKMLPVLRLESAAAAVEAANAASNAGGHGGLNRGQAAALHGLLTSPDAVILVNGYAGSAKTSAVLANYSKTCAAQGFTVIAMAPTASAAGTLGAAIRADSKTMQSALMSLQAAFAKGEKPEGKQVWMLDEASLASTRDLAALTKMASLAQAKLILTGDRSQLGSVEAGQGFAQLQDSPGITTLKLETIVRQKNEHALQAVYSSIEGDARAALDNIDRSGEVKEITVLDEKTGKIDREKSRLARVEAIAKDYSSLTREQRADSIIVAPGRDDREQINTRVRELLQDKGELGENHAATVLEPRGLGKAESKEAQFYTPGDLVTFRKDYQSKGILAGDYLKITKVDVETNVVTMQSRSGKQLEWNPRQWGASSAASFAPIEKQFAVGDALKFKKNDKALDINNGDAVTVTKIENGKAEVTTERGKTLTLDLANPAHQHIAHGYAQTAFAAQGRTAKSVFVHAESHRSNLLNQQSFYVGISRATDTINVYTDDRTKLVNAIQERTGAKLTALEMARKPEPEIKLEPLPEVKKEREHEGLER
ncbi:MAG: MobF family relaxase [Pseudomonadota bacterium]